MLMVARLLLLDELAIRNQCRIVHQIDLLDSSH